MTDWISAMLAERARSVPNFETYAYEPKWDGVRALVLVKDGRVDVRSRHGTDLTLRFPELRGVGRPSRDVLLDGELVVMGREGVPDFGAIRNRIIRSRASAASAATSAPATFIAFDALRVDGTSLLMRSYAERREALESLGLRGLAWRTTPMAVGAAEVDALYRVALAWRIEGIVAKRLASSYEPGRRSPSWLKMKWPWARDIVAFKAHLARRPTDAAQH